MSDVNRSAEDLRRIAREARDAIREVEAAEKAEAKESREKLRAQVAAEKAETKERREKLRAQAILEREKAEEDKALSARILQEFVPSFSAQYLYHFPLSGSSTQLWFVRPNPTQNFELSTCTFNPQKDLSPMVQHIYSLGGEVKTALLEVVEALEGLPSGKGVRSSAEGALQLERQVLLGCIEHVVRGHALGTTLSEYPTSISNDPTVPTTCYYDLSRIVDGPTDAWDDFLARSGPGRWVLPMFLYAMVQGEHFGRQVLNLDGGAGAGKSIFGEAIKALLGAENCHAINDHALMGKFGGRELLGKRALINADLKNVLLAKHELIHQITGRDTIRIEEKYQAAFSSRIHAMIVLMSNSPVRVYGEDNEISRLLPIKILPAAGRTAGELDVNWEKKFISQVFHVAFKGKELYEKYVSGGFIPQKTDLYELDYSSNYHPSYWLCRDVMNGYEVTSLQSDTVDEKDYRSRLIAALTDEMKLSGRVLEGICDTFRRKMTAQRGVSYSEGRFFGVKDRGSAGVKKAVATKAEELTPVSLDDIEVDI